MIANAVTSMITIRGIRNLNDFGVPSVLSIGNFDGLHRGHRKIISRVVEAAKQAAVPAVVMTFDPHPRQVLSPGARLDRLFSRKDLEQQLTGMGVDLLLIEPFTRDLSQLEPEVFFRDYIQRPFAPRLMVEGYDFSFGAHRKGNNELLKRLLQSTQAKLETVEAELLDGVVISSSRIRGLLGEGRVSTANQMLGRRYYVEGVVERGDGRGRTIGFPTANLHSRAEFVPKLGVYAGFAVHRGRQHPAVINIGVNPTFVAENQQTLKLEVHLLDFTGDLYGENLKFEFVDFIRSERKFSGIAELVDQIRRDVEVARTFLC